MTDPRTQLSDPNTTAEQLAALAAAHPELGQQIAAHPNAYPALREWIAQYAPQQPAAPQQAPAPQQPTAPSSPQQSPYGQTPQQSPQQQSPYGQAPQQAPQQQSPYGQAPQHAPQGQSPYGQAPQHAPQGQSPYGQAPQQQSPYGQAPQQSAPQQFGAPGGYPGAPDAGAPVKKKRTGLIVGIAAGTAVVVAGATVGAFALFGNGGGAATPSAAITTMFNKVADVDAIGTAMTFAPSEVKYFEPIFTEVLKLKGPEDGPSYADLQKQLTDAVEVTISDVETEEAELATDVTRVTLTDWAVKADGDEEKVADIVMEMQEAQVREMGVSFGLSEAEIEQQIEESRAQLIAELEFPYEYSAAEFRDESGMDLSFVTVKEQGNWHVSLLLSAADLGYLVTQQQDPSSVGALGTEIIAAQKYDTPEAALGGFVDTISSGATLSDFASTMPLPERRLLSIYGPAFSQSVEGAMDVFEVSESEFSSEIVDGVGRVQIDSLVLPEMQMSFEGICATSVDYYGEEQRNCLDDVPVLDRLGVKDVRLIAVQEDGGWLFGPLATVGDIGGIFAKNFVTYYNEDRLEELFDMG